MHEGAHRRAAGRRVGTPLPRLRPIAALVLLGVLLLGASTGAEIVVLAHGGWMKVTDYRVEGERVTFELPSGGQLTLALLQVARILEDEIVPDPPTPPPTTAPFDLRFAPGQPRPEGPYGELIYEAAERHGLNPALVAAVVRAESAFRPDAVSVKGAQGLMQLMPATARRFGVEGDGVFDPVQNLRAGARYLHWLANRFDDDLPRVLAGYNAGEGTVDRFRGVPPYRETRAYIARIYRTLGLGDWEAGAPSP